MSDAPDPDLLGELLDLAVDLARRAGTFLVDERPDELEVGTKSTPTDVVTQMDTSSERLIVDGLLAARPGDGVVGEEGVAADPDGSSGVRWFVDPLDGTVNYLYRQPVWAVSIAAEVDGQLAVGVVHQPSSGETFTAALGLGAHLDGRRLSAPAPPEPARALVSTGFGYSPERRRKQAAVLAALLPSIRDLRRVGTASRDLCDVATGRVDAYYERGLNPWDYAAGTVIAREAGVRVEGLHGADAGPQFLLAAVDPLHGRLHDLLEPLAPDRD